MKNKPDVFFAATILPALIVWLLLLAVAGAGYAGLVPEFAPIPVEPSQLEPPRLEAPAAAVRKIDEGSPRPGTIWTEPTTGMEFVWVPGGCYEMGSNNGESDEKPVHRVYISGMWLGRYEVTQVQWQKIMGNNPSKFKSTFLKKRENYPVENVSWDDCQSYIYRLNNQTGKSFRLPTEAEWEYAAKGGNQSMRIVDIDDVAWHRSNSSRTTHPVGRKSANAVRLSDMLGNVCEWCDDRYGEDYYRVSPQDNPRGPSLGVERVYRGGCYKTFSALVSPTGRNSYDPNTDSSWNGFRLLLRGK